MTSVHATANNFEDILSDNLNEEQEISIAHAKYKNALNHIKKKGYAKVGFFIVYDSVFSFEKLFKMMQKDITFEPFIVVIPDIIHGETNMKVQLEKTYKVLNKKYHNVYCSYDNEHDAYIDFSDRVDIVCVDNPYDCLTEKFYRIEYLATKGIPTFYTSYGYITSNWHNLDMKEYKLLWINFLLNKIDKEEIKERCITQIPNTMVLGYSKMDGLFNVKARKRDRLKIIIAPHHTIEEGDINYSTFLQYSDLWLELPKKYPDIEFVFRPHPLLKAQLLKNVEWNSQKVEDYFLNMKNQTNVEYQDGGDYFDTFINSDAIIHDCGSFMAEYLYTGKPACYLLKDVERNKKNYNKFAQMCIDQHYKAFNEDDIYQFINNVVLTKNDTMKDLRLKFYEQNLKYGYPHVTYNIMKYLKKLMNINWYTRLYRSIFNFNKSR